MRATGLAAAACLLVSSVAQDLPKTCSAYTECDGLQGDCCPNMNGVMLDCCILGAVRMNAEALEAEANKTRAAAAEGSEEAASAAAKAKKLEEEAAKKKAELKAANEAYAEAEKSAEAAKAEYSKTQKLISDSKCENNPGCADVGLTGFCCPTLNGMTLNGTMLGCCPSSAAPQLAARLAALSEVPPPA